MSAYYNEHDPFAAQWLRNLIAAGLIAPGHVDNRSIEEVRPDDLRGFVQCHFFAGSAGWSLALRLAGWPDDRPVWTGSCPCQPWSCAGKGEAFEDERHLWPVWFDLIRAIRPPVIFGEQVDDAIGWGWLDLVHDDMEAEGYAVRSAVLPACSVGAPHIRDRLWFVADASGERSREAGRLCAGSSEWAACNGEASELGYSASEGFQGRSGQEIHGSASCGLIERPNDAGELGDASINRSGTFNGQSRPRGKQSQPTGGPGLSCLMGDALGPRLEGRPRERGNDGEERASLEQAGDATGPLVHAPGEQMGLPGRPWLARSANPWEQLEWLPCTDGKARPTKPGLFPLAHGVSARVGKLRAAGNAIVPQVAAEFIKAAIL